MTARQEELAEEFYRRNNYGENKENQLEEKREKSKYSPKRQKTIGSMNYDEETSDDESNLSVSKFWIEQFKKKGLEKEAIKPNFDIFSNFIAKNFANIDDD